jgi:hypothetical protein
MVPFNGIRILNEVIVSDHRPMSLNFQCSVGGNNNANSVISHDYCTVPHWSNCDEVTLIATMHIT